MSTIPPNIPLSLPVNSPAVRPANVKTAQAAFFRAALSEVEAAAARPQIAAPQSKQSESPRLPRPGQLLDIRV